MRVSSLERLCFFFAMNISQRLACRSHFSTGRHLRAIEPQAAVALLCWQSENNSCNSPACFAGATSAALQEALDPVSSWLCDRMV
jgi:hypothetical protein